MVITGIALNPKSIKWFLKDPAGWRAQGSPAPYLLVGTDHHGVALLDPMDQRRVVGRGEWESTTCAVEGKTYKRVHTSHGVKPKGVGYGLGLYCALAAFVPGHHGGVCTPTDSSGASNLWAEMVNSGLARQQDNDTETKEDHFELCFETTGDEEHEDPDTGAEGTVVSGQEGCIEQDWQYEVVVPPIDYIERDQPLDEGLIVRVAPGHTIRQYALDAHRQLNVPIDIYRHMPLRGPDDLKVLIGILEALGDEAGLQALRLRSAIFTTSGQMMIPGISPPSEQMQLPFPARQFPPWSEPAQTGWRLSARGGNIDGLSARRRKSRGLSGLGNAPAAPRMSADATRWLNKYGDIG